MKAACAASVVTATRSILKHSAAMALLGCLAAIALIAPVGAADITNPWSGTAGDRASYSAFAFRPTAGLFPDSVNPAGALDALQSLTFDSITFTRPANDTTSNFPIIGTGIGQLSSVAAPVFVDVYATRSGALTYSGYLGSSTTSVISDDGISPIAPGASFTLSFAGITLE